MQRRLGMMVLFATFLLSLEPLKAYDSATSPEHLPADHTGNAADFLQTPAYKNLLTWYAKKAPALPAPQAPADVIVEVKTIEEFLAACKAPAPNTTILLADGRYDVPDIIRIRHVKNLTIRSQSGDRSKVIFDGAKSKNERILWVDDCDGCTVADLTIQNALKYGLTFDANTSTQNVHVYNVHFHNCWQRGLKVCGVLNNDGRHKDAIADTFDDRTRALRAHNGRVEYCLFTADHRKQFDDGVDKGDYIAGMDAMWLKDWTISDNVFMGIQGWHVGGRGAIFIWVKSEDVTVERNLFLGCDRSISFGNPSGAGEHMIHGVIRNNFVLCGANKGIELARTRDCEIYNNTLYDPQADCSRVIHVFEPLGKVAIYNNLLRGTILVDKGEARVENNLLNPLHGWMAHPERGDLHLSQLDPVLKNFVAAAIPAPAAAPAAVTDQALPGTAPAGVSAVPSAPSAFPDFDGTPRPAVFLVGADQPATTLPPIGTVDPDEGLDPATPAAAAVRTEIEQACTALLGVPEPKRAFLVLTVKQVALPARLTGADLQAGLKIEVAGHPQTVAWNDLTNKDLALILEMLTDDGQKSSAAHYTALAKLYTYAKRPTKAFDMVQKAIDKDKSLAPTLPAEIAALTPN